MNSSSLLHSHRQWFRYLTWAVIIGVVALLVGINVWMYWTATPDLPQRHITQSEAGSQCPSGIALAEATKSEDAGDGVEMTYTYYPCLGSNDRVNSFQ